MKCYMLTLSTEIPFQYLWSNGQTSSTINPLNSGEFYVITNDVNGCSDTAFFNFTPSHIENTNDFRLDIYPNPSSDKINLVSLNDQNYILKIYDISYRLISEELIHQIKTPFLRKIYQVIKRGLSFRSIFC